MDTPNTEAPVANWKCLGCGAVCDSDINVKPTPCDFCASTDIISLDIDSGETVTHPR